MEGAKWNEEEAQALEDVRKIIFGFTEMAAVRCAIELGIPDTVENHPGGSMTLVELSSALGCSPSLLHRIMRFLIHHRIFKEVKMEGQDSPVAYAQTPLSYLLMKNNMAPLLLFMSSPELIFAKLSLSKFLVSKNNDGGTFQAAHGVNIWQYIVANPAFKDLFDRGMACLGGVHITTVIENYPAAFEGICCLVDVGGGNGAALRTLVKACPWIFRAINFDLPHVVSSCDNDGRVEHVGGDMFVSVPSADAALIMSVLHDWGDEACVKILNKCREAIAFAGEAGKLIIVDVVMVEDDNLNEESNNKYRDYHLALDIEIMADTISGKERNAKEWANLLTAAGFTKHTIKQIPSPMSVIEAYP